MRKLHLVALLFVVAGPGLFFLDARGQERQDYYPLRPGTKWQYKVMANNKTVTVYNMIEKIDTVNGEPWALQKTTVANKVGATEHLKSDAKGIYRCKFNGVEIKLPVQLLKYPVKPGETWQINHQVGGDTVTGMAKVGNFEEVQVPAGKYRAITLTLTTVSKGQNVNTTYWLARNVGIVKQTATFGGQNVQLELEKFEPAKEQK